MEQGEHQRGDDHECPVQQHEQQLVVGKLTIEASHQFQTSEDAPYQDAQDRDANGCQFD